MKLPRVDFYILDDTSLHARFVLACRLADKAYQQGNQLYMHTSTQADAYVIDDLLWTFREDSFIPHNIYGEGPTPPPPIQIGYDVVPEKHCDIMINLCSDIPEFFKHFRRVIEIVPNDHNLREGARKNYKFYREEGCQLHTHDLKNIVL